MKHIVKSLCRLSIVTLIGIVPLGFTDAFSQKPAKSDDGKFNHLVMMRVDNSAGAPIVIEQAWVSKDEEYSYSTTNKNGPEVVRYFSLKHAKFINASDSRIKSITVCLLNTQLNINNCQTVNSVNILPSGAYVLDYNKNNAWNFSGFSADYTMTIMKVVFTDKREWVKEN